MTAQLLTGAEAYLAAARMALALWLMLVSAHWIAGAGVFGPDGAVPWSQMAGRGMIAGLRRRLSVPVLRLWMGAQMAIAAVLFLSASPPVAMACLFAALVSHGGFLWLSGDYGSSGADKMGMIVLAGTLIGTAGLITADNALLLAGCLVSGGQVLICYMVAGLSKLRQPAWRSGAELRGVMAHPIWGAPWAAALLQARGIALLASWALMLGEALFPLALLLPEQLLIAALAAMFVFHFMTALVMRLTMFPWAYLSAYPAVLLLGQLVRTAVA